MGRWGLCLRGGDGAAGEGKRGRVPWRGAWRGESALPIGFLGGKARSDGMQRPPEGVCALCLQDSAEGKRGRVPWRDIWRGQVRFASKGADEKEIVHVHKKATTLPERDQPGVVAIERSIDIF